MSDVAPPPLIGGTVDPRFSAVRDAFAANVTVHGEAGAAVCVVVDGHVVADLWGGYADAAETILWTADTLVNAFSVGKGLVALLAARVVGEGRLDVDDRVAAGWPAFAHGGKEDITVRHLLSHQAGLPAVRHRLEPGSMLDWRRMTDALEEEEPWWEPGTEHGYHVNTFGFLVGEVLRRRTDQTVGQLLRDTVAGPLGADVHWGLSAAERARTAEFLWPDGVLADGWPADLTGDQLMQHNAYFNPAGLSGAGVVNTDAWRAVEIPSTNLHASARGVARVYAALANGGEIDGVRIVDEHALGAATVEQVYGTDRVLGRSSRFGLGFQLTQVERPLGPNPGAFGHFGAGGSLGFCDPSAGVAFGYVMNTLGPRWQNPRNQALVDAVYTSLT